MGGIPQTKRNYQIVCHKYGLDNHEKLSLTKLSWKYKLSQNRISQIINRFAPEIFSDLNQKQEQDLVDILDNKIIIDNLDLKPSETIKPEVDIQATQL